MKIAIGADHGGFPLKEKLKAHILSLGHQIDDIGTHSTDAVDYPDFALKVAQAVASGTCEYGIMIDGAGIGSSITANKVPGIRAAVCNEIATAVNSKEHNNANVLVLGSGIIGETVAKKVTEAWFATMYTGGRHQKRVDKITAVEKMYSAADIYERVKAIVSSLILKPSAATPVISGGKRLITENDIRSFSGTEFKTSPGDIVTPLARDAAKEKGIVIV